jgi:hypothetical protein
MSSFQREAVVSQSSGQCSPWLRLVGFPVFPSNERESRMLYRPEEFVNGRVGVAYRLRQRRYGELAPNSGRFQLGGRVQICDARHNS